MIPQMPGPPGDGTSIGQEKYGRQKEKKPKPTNDNYVLEPTEINDPYLLDIVADAAKNNILALDGTDDENFAEHVEFMSGSRGDDKNFSTIVMKREKETYEKILRRRFKKKKIKQKSNQEKNGEVKEVVTESKENEYNNTTFNKNGNQRLRPVSKMIHVMYHRLMNKSLADAMSFNSKSNNKTPSKSMSNSMSNSISGSTQNTPAIAKTTDTTAVMPISSKSSKRKNNKKFDKIMSISTSRQSKLNGIGAGVGVGIEGIQVRTETAEAHEARMQRLAKGLAQIFLHQQKRKKKLGINKLVGYNGDGKLPRCDSEKEKNRSFNLLESMKNVFRAKG